MAFVKMFKAAKQTRRFNLNQKVWIHFEAGNFLSVMFRYRGKGRYVEGRLSKWDNRYSDWHPVIGPDGLKKIEVSDEFAQRFSLQCFEKDAD